MKTFLAAATAVCLASSAASAQVGNLLWEDNFDTLDHWIPAVGNGSWGWGNGELEYYSADNVDIAPVPGEPGNLALRITARQETGPTITDQWGNPLQYTSGRVSSLSHVSVQYGMIEARVRVPDLDLGGWPAVWMLGTTNWGWPRKGEFDLMEMGSRQSFRDLHDTHNGGNGLDNSTVNEVVGANAIFYTEDAINPQNPSGAASLSYDPDDDYCRPYYNHTNPLNDRFVLYRLYWDDSSVRFTIVDGGQEFDLYTSPFTIDAESEEFRAPFYFLLNLAVGGAFTDAYNLGDPGSGAPVSMSFPAEMYIDYLRVYEWNGQGSVQLGPPTEEIGTFGLFTETTPVDNELIPDVNGRIFVWEDTLVDGTIPPYEGSATLTWQTNNKGWFGAGIFADQPLNLFGFPDGDLTFRIKIPANVTFKIGIIDVWGNQNYVTFPAFTTTYGLVRDGEWGQATIPVTDVRGLAMDLRMLVYPFVILEENGVACEFAIDDVYWSGGNAPTDVTPISSAASGYGLRANVPNPFPRSTEIRFELPAASAYAITIYDVMGRRVAAKRGQGAGGGNSVRWDGMSEAGTPVAPGVYYYRLTAGEITSTRKMMLVK